MKRPSVVQLFSTGVALLVASCGPEAALDESMQSQDELNLSAPIRIASYNILGSNHVAKGTGIGECGGPAGCVTLRASRATEAIHGNTQGPLGSPVDERAMDVVGVQEMVSDQFRLFDTFLPGYDHYPVQAAGRLVQTTIYYRRDRFQRVSAGTIQYPSYGNDGLHPGRPSPWVQLKDTKTGEKFIVFNHHSVAWNKDPGSDLGGALKREATAKILRDWVAERRTKNPEVPIFVIGDFNSRFILRSQDRAYQGKRSRLPYCIMSAGGVTRHVLDVIANRQGCPIRSSTKDGFSIDHIFIAGAGQMKVLGAGRMKRDADSPTLSKASDHAPVYADIRLRVRAMPSPVEPPEVEAPVVEEPEVGAEEGEPEAPADAEIDDGSAEIVPEEPEVAEEDGVSEVEPATEAHSTGESPTREGGSSSVFGCSSGGTGPAQTLPFLAVALALVAILRGRDSRTTR